MWRIFLTFEILWLILQARRIRVSKARKGVSLPVVYSSSRMNTQKAHCWLTIDEQLFHEKENALQLYPIDMGYNRKKSIRYWIGPELNQAILDESHITKTRTIQSLFNRFKDS